ncbi:MAG: diaminopimelate epimerase [Nitrospirae bacterium]|nr:diaminopimelate epimerase [Nitrospirota bacterium]
MPFTKMHGIGNDFIVIDCRKTALSSELSALSELSRRLCHRRFGIGADQILLLYNSAKADFQMRIFNADGSEVEMCGNGIRCFAKYIWDRKLSGKSVLEIETAAGIIRPEKAGDLVRVDMGTPVLEGRQIPVDLDGVIKDYPLKVEDKTFNITCVSMGNPHAVIFVDDVDGLDVQRYGSRIETHPLFPRRVNVEFVHVIDPKTLRMRVWERGSGETMACGTGASAAAVAANLKGVAGKKVTVKLLGGDLLIELNADGHVYMTGPAEEVFEGRIEPFVSRTDSKK